MTIRTTLIGALSALLAAGAAIAATQGEVDEKYQIPVPEEQRKITPGETTEYQDGELSLELIEAARTSVTVAANGGDPVEVPASTEILIDIGDERICTVVFLGLVGKRAIVSSVCSDATEPLRAAYTDQQNAEAVEVVDPAVLIADAEQGSLENPHLDDPEAIEQGRALFLNNSCNGCHGGNGGGGMGPALSNGVWVSGSEDDTLFRLVTLGSEGLLEQGYSRVAREKVVGPMPPYEGIITSSDELWKILAFVRSTSPSDAPEAP